MLRHARLEMTQIYTRVAIHKLKAICYAAHPGAWLKAPAPGEASPLAAEPPVRANEACAEILAARGDEADGAE